jgi:hypothetical protein
LVDEPRSAQAPRPLCVCARNPGTGAARQRQHWPSHKRQCRALAAAEFRSTRGRYTSQGTLEGSEPSDGATLLKLSATVWTLRDVSTVSHVASLRRRAVLLWDGRPVPGGTEEKLVGPFKRVVTETPRPELPGRTQEVFKVHLRALSLTALLGKPEAAVEVSSRHVPDVKRGVVAPKFVTKYHLCRLEWLLSAARKFEGDEGKREGYVAEAKEVTERATRGLRGLRPQDWEFGVSFWFTCGDPVQWLLC